MAAYGTVRTYAQRLGREQVAQLLEKTLEEEKAADAKLTEISDRLYRHQARAA
jgi:ferritin-like metal-binding protein YciE